MLDLEPIKARLRAARWHSDPWQRVWVEHDNWTGWAIGYPLPPYDRIDGWACVARVEADRPGRGTYYGEGRMEIADLITCGPSDLAALIAEVERLRAAAPTTDLEPCMAVPSHANEGHDG